MSVILERELAFVGEVDDRVGVDAGSGVPLYRPLVMVNKNRVYQYRNLSAKTPCLAFCVLAFASLPK